MVSATRREKPLRWVTDRGTIGRHLAVEEPVDVGVLVDEREVGDDLVPQQGAARRQVARPDGAAGPAAARQNRSATAAYSAGGVAEVAVEDGAADAGLGGDVLHGHAPSPLADGAQGRVEQLGPAGSAARSGATAGRLMAGTLTAGRWSAVARDHRLKSNYPDTRRPDRYPARRGARPQHRRGQRAHRRGALRAAVLRGRGPHRLDPHRRQPAPLPPGRAAPGVVHPGRAAGRPDAGRDPRGAGVAARGAHAHPGRTGPACPARGGPRLDEQIAAASSACATGSTAASGAAACRCRRAAW